MTVCLDDLCISQLNSDISTAVAQLSKCYRNMPWKKLYSQRIGAIAALHLKQAVDSAILKDPGIQRYTPRDHPPIAYANKGIQWDAVNTESNDTVTSFQEFLCAEGKIIGVDCRVWCGDPGQAARYERRLRTKKILLALQGSNYGLYLVATKDQALAARIAGFGVEVLQLPLTGKEFCDEARFAYKAQRRFK